MINNPHQVLKDLAPAKLFFVGIDSDGCVFDTMEIKHKKCFCPNFIQYWGLQNISKYAEETWDFVNLYSKTRGCNRFLAVTEVIKLLSQRSEIQAYKFKLPDITQLINWIEKESKLGTPELERYAKEVNDPVINKTLEWTKAVNNSINEMVKDIPPFPFVNESLIKLNEKADLFVVSQTPAETLNREWKEHHIDKYVSVICGQEYGTKAEHIKYAAKGKYADDKILMIGDAPGDLKAAKSNDVLFYPINPGNEIESWERLYNEGINHLLEGTFAGGYEKKLIEDFNKCLPEVPPWENSKILITDL